MIKCGNKELGICPETNDFTCCKECGRLDTCMSACDESLIEKGCEWMIDGSSEISLFESKEAAAINAMVDLLERKKALEAKEKEVRAALIGAMDKYGVKSFSNDRLKITHIEATTKKSLDSKKLKKDYPDLYEEYLKESKVSASVRIQLKGGD